MAAPNTAHKNRLLFSLRERYETGAGLKIFFQQPGRALRSDLSHQESVDSEYGIS
jgi:hypothetical protein